MQSQFVEKQESPLYTTHQNYKKYIFFAQHFQILRYNTWHYVLCWWKQG
jgi:hypothetical protein